MQIYSNRHRISFISHYHYNQSYEMTCNHDRYIFLSCIDSIQVSHIRDSIIHGYYIITNNNKNISVDLNLFSAEVPFVWEGCALATLKILSTIWLNRNGNRNIGLYAKIFHLNCSRPHCISTITNIVKLLKIKILH